MSDPRITEAAIQKLHASTHSAFRRLGIFTLGDAREVLEAALPLLVPQPVVDREELRQLVTYCREREVYKGRDNEIGADTAYGDVADRLDAILALLAGSAETDEVCTCRPGMIGHWGCPVEGHDVSDGDLE